MSYLFISKEYKVGESNLAIYLDYTPIFEWCPGVWLHVDLGMDNKRTCV